MDKLLNKRWIIINCVVAIGVLGVGSAKGAIVSNSNLVTISTTVTSHCHFYNNSQQCANEDNYSLEQCPRTEHGKGNHCFTLWKEFDNGTTCVVLKGCMLLNEECIKSTCVANSANANGVLYCCCVGNMCNEIFSYVPKITEAPPPSPSTVPTHIEDNLSIQIMEIIFGIILVIFVVAAAAFCFTRRHKHYFNGLPTSEPNPSPPPSPYMDMRPIQLLEIKARGRFGAVWKAQLKNETIAVKIFPLQDKQSWQAEQEIFKLPCMNHPNILHFIGMEKRGDNLQAEFWLITAYHERGSLCDFLKAHTITWPELCRISETMTRGLMHLHEAIPGRNPGESGKPSIAHRDFKSKNVLLKDDMSACIADFGLAIVFESGKSCGDAHGQVGTRRYMAPEVLEGAINFTPDAFLRIDMYACGLVLWELVSRCTAQDGPIPEYRLPFEEEVGQHPTLEDMQETVVQRKVRPSIPEHWRSNPSLLFMCDTIEECWDHDAEARLSASCVMERVMLHSKYQQQQTLIINQGHNDIPLTPLKEISI